MKRLCFLFATCLLISGFMATPVSASGMRFNMSYLYFGSPSSYASAVDHTNESLDELSPNYFILNPDGTLKLEPSISKDFVHQMHRQNVRVVPFLSNHWDQDLGIAAMNNQEVLASQIAAAVEEYDLDGIHIDLENLTQAHRQAYYEFVKLLREKIPTEKTVAVAVAANPYNITVGWNGSYDYEKLAEVADYLMVMAYDEHYAGSSPGPISSISFAEKSITYALQYAPSKKIVLGIPFYGRIWSDSGNLMNGQGISDARIQQLVQSYQGVVQFDQLSQSALAKITIKADDQKPVILGKTLTAGSYSIWFENEPAKKALLKLVDQYDLKGTGSWSLGQETQQTWDYYRLWLNGLYFIDVQGHWAMQAIASVGGAGLMEGISTESFEPDRSLTRAEAAVTLVRMLKLSAAPAGAGDFVDTTNHWARDEIVTAKYYGLINGLDGNWFNPDAPITRQEMAVLLDRAISPLTPLDALTGSFPDVSTTENFWSYDAIERLTKAGILEGYPDGSFQPNAQLTRGQMAALLARINTN